MNISLPNCPPRARPLLLVLPGLAVLACASFVHRAAPAQALSPTNDNGIPAQALPQINENGLHDPSTIIKRNGVYHVWGTGEGIAHLTSTDLVTWKQAAPVFPKNVVAPWVQKVVPGFKGFYWAPDCLFLNGRYLLYYSCSMGGRESAIGLAVSTDLEHWSDEGLIVASDQKSPFGSIDPAMLLDNGKLWLAFGSHLKGIYLMQLNPQTGKPLTSAPRGIASDPDGEAAYIVHHGSDYFLFYNRGRCCAGNNSTYEIMMGRAQSITGPYLDKQGRPLLSGGGSSFDSSDGARIGPGHFALLREGGIDRFSFHFYDGLKNGTPTLGLETLVWGEDGWPRPGVDLEGGRYAILSKASGLALGVQNNKMDDGTPVDQFEYRGGPTQGWNISPVGDGFYGIQSLGTGKYFDLFQCQSADGTKISLYPWFGNDCQKWRIEPTSDGAYRLVSKGGGTAVTLPGNVSTPQAVVQGFGWKGQAGQEWIFKPLPFQP